MNTFIGILGFLLRMQQCLMGTGDTSNLKSTLSKALKDLGYYTTYESDTHAEHLVASAIMKTISIASDEGHADEHMPTMVSYIAARN